MSSGMFRGKYFSNRIELSRLVQDVLKFHCFGCYPPFGGLVGGLVGGCGCGWVGATPTHARTCTCTYTHMHTCMIISMIIMQMAVPIGGIPGNSL